MKNSIFIWLILCFAFVSCFNTNKNKRIGDLIIKKNSTEPAITGKNVKIT